MVSISAVYFVLDMMNIWSKNSQKYKEYFVFLYRRSLFFMYILYIAVFIGEEFIQLGSFTRDSFKRQH